MPIIDIYCHLVEYYHTLMLSFLLVLGHKLFYVLVLQ